MTEEQKNSKELGDIGENWVVHILGGTLSENEYDMEKDGVLLNGETFEVKTQCRYTNKFGIDYLTINVSQKTKCMNVDNLYFVEYSVKKTNNYIRIWKCTNREKYITYTTKAGNNMIGFPISEMELSDEGEYPKLAAHMRSLSKSTLIEK